MSSFGRVELAAVWRMMNKCAKGYAVKEGKHKLIICFGGKKYPGLPMGKRNLKKKEVYVAEVRKMLRFLEVPPDCAETAMPALAPLNYGLEKNSRGPGQ